ncbi:neurotensin receptor type 1-like [Asterias rubens]|uniref:neurotensin receptor type 1-like n=1 Tax=Asterias rubens TaxID=7604 RepID=UPI00145543C4|nr:neurotensin receptor type 1-like [Asterias rubens]
MVYGKEDGLWEGGYTVVSLLLCYLVTILDSATAHASILTLLAIAVERYYVICMPFKANYTCTSKRTLIICCLVWLIAFISSVPLALTVVYSNTEAGCVCGSFANTTLKEAYVGGIAVGFFLLPCAFMAIIYCVIANTLRKHDNYMASIRNKESLGPASGTPVYREGRLVELATMPRKNSGDSMVENNYVPLKNHVTSNSTNEEHEPTVAFIENEANHEAAMRPSNQSSSNNTCQNLANAATRQAHRRVVLMMASVVAVFFLCWFPMRTVILWQIFAPKESIRAWLGANMHTFQVMIAIFRILVYINSAINPILYNLISSKFRVAFRSVIRCENARRARSKRLGVRSTMVVHPIPKWDHRDVNRPAQCCS